MGSTAALVQCLAGCGRAIGWTPDGDLSYRNFVPQEKVADNQESDDQTQFDGPGGDDEKPHRGNGSDQSGDQAGELVDPTHGAAEADPSGQAGDRKGNQKMGQHCFNFLTLLDGYTIKKEFWGGARPKILIRDPRN